MNTLPQNSRKHKKLYVLLISLFISLAGFTQNVSISAKDTLPNAAAGLDVYFPNKGLLIPRVALTGSANFAPLSAHVNGMIVYNTAIAGDVKPGFYYDDGTKWVTGFPVGTNIGDMLFWNGTAWAVIPAGTSGQYLQLSASNVPQWAGVATANLTTNTITSITATSATSGGNILSDNGSTVLSRGICYALTQNPTTANTIVLASPVSGIGTYSCNMTGLTRATTYYVRAYATNSSVTSYATQQTFTTLPTAPVLGATTAYTNLASTSATTGGNVTDDGGSTLTERGICYGIANPPTTSNTKIVDPSSTIGSFVSNITGLTPNTLYYARSYAINALGTTYGSTTINFYTLPTVTTAAITNTTPTTATGGGNVTSSGIITARGVCWSTSTGPTVALATKTSDGTTLGVYASNITGLAANTTYYVRAYASNSYGSAYGPEISFTTPAPTVPVIAGTNAITNISDRSATSGGTITSDGGSPILSKGVCWSSSPSPILGTANYSSDGTGTAAFSSSSLTGLLANTVYYVRAYATNALGTSYGPLDVSFTTWMQAPYTLGQNLGYGYVGYINALGHGFIYSYDIPYTGGWGCNGITLGCSSALGTGRANTMLIIANAGATTTAASTARAYSVTYNGVTYSNWYLPSSGEWANIAAQRLTNGLWNMGYQNYYTSSEYVSGNTYAGTYWNTGAQCTPSGTSRAGGTSNYVYYLKVIMDF